MDAPGTLPAPRCRRARGGPCCATIAVRVEVATPILGGSSQTRAVDEIDVIRPVTVRGHLRFWWRALHGDQFSTPGDLYAAESALWGRAASDGAGRSPVEVRVDVDRRGGIDEEPIRLYGAHATPGAYALWPAREQAKDRVPTAPRRLPGTRFTLTLLVPEARATEVRHAVHAWLLFGGYGSRTRRGVGSFRVVGDADAWLPTQPTREAFAALFGRDVFAPPSRPASDTPWLAGAALHIGAAHRDACGAWTTALDWLKDFRQGTRGGPGERAREPGDGKPQPARPSVSNWPEADKIRHLRGKTKAHPPRHNARPAWPRAGFGLPIVGQFQDKARDGGRLVEPGPFELRWRAGPDDHDRLASPLIVKALPLADDTFVPCALWLHRAYPPGEVILQGTAGSGAAFDLCVAPGDKPLFSALAGKGTLRTAFLAWLCARHQATVVAP